MAAVKVSRSVSLSTYKNFDNADDVLIADDPKFDYARLSEDNWSSLPVFDWHEFEGGKDEDQRRGLDWNTLQLVELLGLSSAAEPREPSATMHKLPSFTRSKVPSTGKPWVHPPESLASGRVVYPVKFLGNVEVEQPKGADMVRDAIRKMKFNKQIKLAEGEKPSKVELVISIDSILIQDAKFKVVQFKYPLHHVSYCADDKADKRMFTFIAKDKDTDGHRCFVFDSDKCAEEITLTLGQAFNLAYQRFLDSSNKNVDMKKQLLMLQKKVTDLTDENTTLKDRVATLEKLLDQKKVTNGLTTPESRPDNKVMKLRSVSIESYNGSSVSSATSPSVTSPSIVLPILAPPPPVPNRSHIPQVLPVQSSAQSVDLFGSTPFSPTALAPPPRSLPVASRSDSVSATVMSPVWSPRTVSSPGSDPFGMQVFSPTSTQSDFDLQLRNFDNELMDMQANFSRGLSFGTEDFSIEDLDPCKK